MPQVKANGLSFEYESFGRAADPTILLIMGFSAQMTMWPVNLCQGLADKGYRVVRFDNRDVGKSEKLERLGLFNPAEAFAKVAAGQAFPAPYVLNDMANDAAGILSALDIGDAHIVGASMGGMIAQLVAVNHPARTRSVTSIMSTTGRPGLPPAKPEAMAVLMTPPANDERETRIAAAMRAWRVIGSVGPLAADDAELRSVAENEVDRVPYYPQGIARQLVGILASQPRHEMLKSVKAPALVIHGEADPLVPIEGGRDTAASIPGARLVTVPYMGHDFSQKLVPTYIREIGNFVDDVERRRKAA
ncbi:MAG: alpha/beta fold hydrolase [Alphaproteobacteria bacterium]|nr:alpha/beta fold hydrolase [Alphaproteobacteria bacterium]